MDEDDLFAALGYQDDILGSDFAAIGEDWEDELNDLFAGEEEIISGGKAGKLAALARRMKAIRSVDPKAVIVKSQQARRRRVLDLGLPVTTIAAGATQVIEVKPQRVFRAEDLTIPDAVAQACELVSAQVGQNSQLAGGSPVALDAYSNLCAHRSGFLWDTANPGILIQLQVRNYSAGSVDFRGSLKGTSTVR